MTSTRSYLAALGKRKTARARVKMFQEGTGKFTINEMPIKEYFSGVAIENATAPLALAGMMEKTDIEARVSGGGKEAQSDAVRLGISRAMLMLNADYRGDLKRAGFLRRDDRIKERKKPGLKRARRGPQFSKR